MTYPLQLGPQVFSFVPVSPEGRNRKINLRLIKHYKKGGEAYVQLPVRVVQGSQGQQLLEPPLFSDPEMPAD